MNQTNNYGMPGEMVDVLRELKQKVDEQEELSRNRNTPFNIEVLERLVDSFLEGPKKEAIKEFKEGYEQEKIIGEKFLDDFVRGVILEWAGSNRGFPFTLQEVTTNYTVKGVCPQKFLRDPFDKYVIRKIPIDRETLADLRGHEYFLADQNKPYCSECSLSEEKEILHEPDVSFIEYHTPIHDRYFSLIQEIQQAEQAIMRTTDFGRARKQQLFDKLVEEKRSLEDASALFVGARVKGDNSLRRKLLGKVIDLDERMPDTEKIMSGEEQKILVKDRLGTLMLVPERRHGYAFLEYLTSGELQGKGVFGIFHDKKNSGIKDHWARPKKFFSGLKFTINYCDALVECRIQTPSDYARSEADHGPYRYRYDQRIKRVEKEQGIPCTEIETLIGKLFP